MNDRKRQSIDVEKIDLERLKEQTSDKKSTFHAPTDRGSVSFEPTQKGVIKSRSQRAMHDQIDIQMQNIMEQIQVLYKQAEKLKERKVVSEMVYQADINFEPIVGKAYFLYKNSNDKLTLSMIAPEDWGRSTKMEFLAEVELLGDRTWKVHKSSESFSF